MAARCGVCLLLGKQCSDECLYRALFPTVESTTPFFFIKKIFGLANFKRMIEECPEAQRPQLVASLEFEAKQRLLDRKRGCEGLIRALEARLGLEPEGSSVVVSHCMACLCLGKVCTPNCVYRPCFLASEAYECFLNVKNVFCVRRFEKLLLETEDLAVREEIADSFNWEATYRVNHPVTGCHGRVLELQGQLNSTGNDARNAN